METNYCWLVSFIYLMVVPFTKVEESFGIQAIHDVLYHGTNISQYDHMEFPGVVPRSFIGPLLVALASLPAKTAAQLIFPMANKMVFQVLTRATLGAFVLCAFGHLVMSVRGQFGSSTAHRLVLITATQFHFNFYASRTLPNTFALIPALLALSFWIRGRAKLFVLFSAFSALIFRGELVLLFGPCLLVVLAQRQLSIGKTLSLSVGAAVFAIMLTVLVDSVFWQRWLWPEGDVLWFNIVLNKSSDWGTSPFLWYFYSALPRGLLLSLGLIPVGLWLDRRTLLLLLPSVAFVFLFSFLAHKELRFIIYVFPLLNTIAAVAFDRIAKNWSKHFFYKLLWIGCVVHLLLNGVCSALMLYVSRLNYPGGIALQVLHQVVPCEKDVHVHIANLAAQTGVTRFGEDCDNWIYNKTEHLEERWSEVVTAFTHIIAEDNSPILNLTKKTHRSIGVVQGLSKVDFRSLKVEVEPKLHIFTRKVS